MPILDPPQGGLLELVGPSVRAANTDPDPSWGARNEAFEEEVLVLVNKHRDSIGREPVGNALDVDDCSGWKALHMAGYAYMDHNDPAPPVARTCATRFADFGVSGSWGENIAYGYTTPAAVMQGWLASPGHRANIENPSFNSLGPGAARHSGNPWYWCQCFSSGPAFVPPPTEADYSLRFSDRHAIGIAWDEAAFPVRELELFVWSSGKWSKVRDIPNNGDTYVTYPLPFEGTGRVKVAGGGVALEGDFDVQSLEFA